MMREPEASAGGDDGYEMHTEAWNRLEQILELFERALSRGERPVLDDFLPDLKPNKRRALLAELVHAELEFRLKAAEPVRVEDYLTRYPELRSNSDVLLGLIRAEYQVRRRRELTLSRAEYQARFPEHGAALARLLAATLGPGMGADEARPTLVGSGPEDVNAVAGRLPPLARLGDFRILREIGRGAMGVVYEAEQVSLGRHVALKVLPQKLLADAQTKKRFEREAKSAAKLHHTNIVPVFGVGEQDGMPYYVMQFIRGMGLDEVLEGLKQLQPRAKASGCAPTLNDGELRGLRSDISAADVARSLLTGQFVSAAAENATAACTARSAPAATARASVPATESVSDSFSLSTSSVTLPGTAPESGPNSLSYWRSTARIGLQVADALDYAHKQGVQHRDIKPSNLLLDTAGTVWVTDFGLAKADDEQNLTQTGDILGTLRYMPPESFDGRTDARGDIYALGLTLYELLCLRPAFDERNRNRLIKQVTTTEPARLDRLNRAVPRDLVTIVHKAIERNPAHRYPTAAALAADLQRFLADESIHARRQTELERCVRWARHHRGIAVLGGVLAAVLVLATMASLLAAGRFNQAAQSERAARREAEEAGNEARRYGDAERWGRYRSNIAAASAALQLQNSGAARSALDDAPEEHRNWEWQYLHSQLDGAALVLPAPGGKYRSHALSPSGRQVAVCGADSNEVYLYDVATGKSDAVLRGHSAPATSVVYRPDGQQVATASNDQTIRLWDPATGQQTALLKAEIAPPNSDRNLFVAYNSDGSRIVSSPGIFGWGSTAGASRLWDTTTGQEITVLAKWQEGGRPVAFSPDGKRVVVGSGKSVYLCDAATGHRLAALGPYAKTVQLLAYSPDGSRVASATAGEGPNAIHLWDGEGGNEVAVLSVPFLDSIVFSPDGSRLASGSNYPDNVARLWEAATGREVGRLEGHKNAIWGVAFSPDGSRVVTASLDTTGRLWDGRTGQFLAVLGGHTGLVTSVLFSPDGSRVVTASKDATLRLWNAQGELMGVLRGHVAGFDGSCPPIFTPDGSRLVSGTADGTVRIWDMSLVERNGILRGHESYVYDVAFNPNGQEVASAAWDGTVRLWNPDTGRQTRLFTCDQAIVSAVAYSPDGGRIATVNHGLRSEQGSSFAIWDASTVRQPTWRASAITRNVGNSRVVFSPDGTLVVVGSKEGPIHLRDAATGAQVADLLGHEGLVMDVAFDPDGVTLACAGSDGTIWLWDVAARRALGVLRGYTAHVYRIAFSADGKLLASGSHDATVRLWSTRSHEPLANIPVGSVVYGVAFSPDGTRLALGLVDNTVRLIDVATRQEVVGLRGHTDYVHAVAWSPDGTRLISGSGDGTVRVWDSLSFEARSRASRGKPTTRDDPFRPR